MTYTEEERKNIIDMLDKNEAIAKKIYATLIEDGIASYKEMFSAVDYRNSKDEYWIKAMSLFRSLDKEQQQVFYEIIRQIMVDTGATLLAILEGSASLSGGGAFESEITIDRVNAGYLLDYFLSTDEEKQQSK